MHWLTESLLIVDRSMRWFRQGILVWNGMLTTFILVLTLSQGLFDRGRWSVSWGLDVLLGRFSTGYLPTDVAIICGLNGFLVWIAFLWARLLVEHTGFWYDMLVGMVSCVFALFWWRCIADTVLLVRAAEVVAVGGVPELRMPWGWVLLSLVGTCYSAIVFSNDSIRSRLRLIVCFIPRLLVLNTLLLGLLLVLPVGVVATHSVYGNIPYVVPYTPSSLSAAIFMLHLVALPLFFKMWHEAWELWLAHSEGADIAVQIGQLATPSKVSS